MTSPSDRFLRACRHEPVDVTPIWFMRQAGRSQPEYRALRERYSLLEIVRRPELCAEVTLRPVEQLEVDAAILFADITVPLMAMGVELDLVEDIGPRVHAPIRDSAGVAALRPFAIDETVAALTEAIRLIRRAAPVPLIGFAGAPFTLAAYLVEGGPSRDFPLTRALMHREPQVWEDLMNRLTDGVVAYVQAQIRAGVQAVQLFDSWVGCLSPRDFVRSVGPYSARVLAAVAAAGVPSIHFGTNTAGLLEPMAASGGDVMGVDWRMDLGEAWRRIGWQRGIQGNLDPAAPLAEVPVMLEGARLILEQAAGRPGHIFNLGHGVLP
ncbi:MAG TPA: uroporphyrinogen decarboxylase, partial [bacterium]|nr:uroporphyrinogen decarboxylase [bacterium]